MATLDPIAVALRGNAALYSDALRRDLGQVFRHNAEIVEVLSGPDLIRLVLQALRDASH